MTNHTHTDTPDHNRSTVVFDMALRNAAQKAENAEMDPVLALSHQLHMRRLNRGTPSTQAKRPRHEAVLCQRCEVVDVLIGRLPIFPAVVSLDSGHRVTLKAGPALVLDAALFRAERKLRARTALRRTLLPSQPGECLLGPTASYLKPQEQPGWPNCQQRCGVLLVQGLPVVQVACGGPARCGSARP